MFQCSNLYDPRIVDYTNNLFMQTRQIDNLLITYYELIHDLYFEFYQNSDFTREEFKTHINIINSVTYAKLVVLHK